MTWVFGNATILGSAICVADIQVTAEGKTFDCLRKLYALDENIIAGFAGDVYAGFAMLTQLHHLIEREKSISGAHADVGAVLKRFPDVAQTAFRSLPRLNRDGGSEILVAGASPASDRLYGSQPRVARFVAPQFALDEAPPGEWVSIGTGSEVASYRTELEAVTSDEARSALFPLEANNPGGYAQAMFIAILDRVTELPSVEGISKHFHIGIVFAHGVRMGSSDRMLYPPEGEPIKIKMPPVAEGWAGLQRILSERLGVAVTAATAPSAAR